MDPHYKAIWLEALRSGKYHQGQGNLKTKDGKFCCLGVLVDALGCQWRNSYSDRPNSDRPNSDRPNSDRPNIGRIIAFDADGKVLSRKGSGDYEGYLSDDVLNKIGLTAHQQADLANRNDGFGDFHHNPQTFEQIAKHIEETL